MPDFELAIDQLRVDMAKANHSQAGKSADYWDGYRKGKYKARSEIAGIVCAIYFSVAAIGYFFG